MSLQTTHFLQRNLTLKERPLHTHAEWNGTTDQEGDTHAPTIRTKGPSLQTIHVQQKTPTSKDRSLHTHVEWSGKTDQENALKI